MNEPIVSVSAHTFMSTKRVERIVGNVDHFVNERYLVFYVVYTMSIDKDLHLCVISISVFGLCVFYL